MLRQYYNKLINRDDTDVYGPVLASQVGYARLYREIQSFFYVQGGQIGPLCLWSAECGFLALCLLAARSDTIRLPPAWSREETALWLYARCDDLGRVVHKSKRAKAAAPGGLLTSMTIEKYDPPA